MNLWLLRHGEAEPRKTTDEARRLTAYGQQEVLQTALLLKDKKIDLVLHSPYARAVETAMIVCKETNYVGKVRQVDWITPDDLPKEVVHQLDLCTEKNILVVSHQPLLGSVVSLLVEGNLQHPMPLATAQLVHLQSEEICIAGMCIIKE